ncbi:unnamed protein product [Linum trigynum]|uniref:Acyl-[acyl-carrier-protein] hydrolase n=1 Tax=Linum trigynum TaxID=586398 RepID=A0AAV2CI83_9ROSI
MSTLSCQAISLRLPLARCELEGSKQQRQMSSTSVKVKGVKSATSPTSSSSSSCGAVRVDREQQQQQQGVAVAEEEKRQNIPREKKWVDRHRQGMMIENGVAYRQTVVVRSYEVGPDKTATLDSILNLLQETALNHVWMSGLLGNGFGATHGMVRNNLIWVVSRMQVQVDHYPIWGEVLDIETWVGASGKNGMRRDWLIRSQATGQVFARATSTWVMMNEKTRRLSKMPEEVRQEISPWFIHKQAIPVPLHDAKILKLDTTAKYRNTDLKPRRSDLDMNHHVNNVKYVNWMLEAIPDQFLESRQLSGIILEYRRECGRSDTVESLCHPDQDEDEINLHLHNAFNGSNNNNIGILNGFSLLPSLDLDLDLDTTTTYTHLLRAHKLGGEEIVRGKTMWKKRLHLPLSH